MSERAHRLARIGGQWTGFTAFFTNPDYMRERKGRYDVGPPLPAYAEPSGQDHKAKPLASPLWPSKANIEAHNLTHLPHPRWCSVCVRSKGKESLQNPTSDRRLVTQMDFAFMPTKMHEDNSATLSTEIGNRTQMAMATIADSMSMHCYSLTDFTRLIHDTGRAHAVPQAGDGTSIKALARACASEIGSITMRIAPTASSQSRCVMESFQQTPVAQVRTIRVAAASTSRHDVGQEEMQVDHPRLSPDRQAVGLGSEPLRLS